MAHFEPPPAHRTPWPQGVRRRVRAVVAFSHGQFGVCLPPTGPVAERADFAVWRPTTATWYLKFSTRIQDQRLQWGATGDVPVSGDYNGAGKADYAVWRPTTATW